MLRNTIVFPVNGNRVLLGMKKRGFGVGWWNGFGGKLKADETFEEAARRETTEEAGIDITELRLVARLLFHLKEQPDILAHAYVSEKFIGLPAESEEMRPKWFPLKELPFNSMWPGDSFWIPEALMLKKGDAPLVRELYFGPNNTFRKIQNLKVEQLNLKTSLNNS